MKNVPLRITRGEHLLLGRASRHAGGDAPSVINLDKWKARIAIYNLTEISSSYRSRYRSFVRQEVKDRLQPHQTFGYVVEPLHPPSDFLRKRSKSAHPTSSLNHRPLEHHNHFEVRLKAPLEDWGGKIVHNNVNHLKKNIRRAQTATHRGDFSELETSGLIPKYALLPKFGKVPKYIIERKKEEELRKKEQEERMRKSSPGPKIIPEAERLKILQVRLLLR